MKVENLCLHMSLLCKLNKESAKIGKLAVLFCEIGKLNVNVGTRNIFVF